MSHNEEEFKATWREFCVWMNCQDLIYTGCLYIANYNYANYRITDSYYDHINIPSIKIYKQPVM